MYFQGREEHARNQRGQEEQELKRDLTTSKPAHVDQLVGDGLREDHGVRLEDRGDGHRGDQDILRRRLSGQGGELLQHDEECCHEGWLCGQDHKYIWRSHEHI